MFSALRSFRAGRRAAAAGAALTLVAAGAASAATFHRFVVTQSSGSGGATAFVQSAAGASALQGEVNSSANTSIHIPFGVLGEYDAPGSQFGIGVVGITTTGYAVGAESFSHNPSVIALAPSGNDGVDAYTSGATGSQYPNAIYGEADGTGNGVSGASKGPGAGGYFSAAGTGPGAVAISSTQDGLEAFSMGNSTATAGYFNGDSNASGIYATTGGSNDAVVANGNDGDFGVLGDSDGEGVVAYGTSGNVSIAALAAIDSVGGSALIQGFTHSGGNAHSSFLVEGSTLDRSTIASATGADVEITGDVYVTGRVYEACAGYPVGTGTDCEPVDHGTSGTGTGAGAVRGADGNDVAMFHGSQSAPSVEDEGTARLTGGRAYVRLDPAFARTMAQDRPYRVYVTPAGDSRGLFVANRNGQGFEVRENMHGTSTVDFDYRVVAAPFGDRSQRLAIVPRAAVRASAPGDARVAAQLAHLDAMRAADRRRVPFAARARSARPADLVTRAR